MARFQENLHRHLAQLYERIAQSFICICGYISFFSFVTSILGIILEFKTLKYEVASSFPSQKHFSWKGDQCIIRYSCIQLYFCWRVEIAKTCWKCLRKDIKSVQKVFGSYLRWPKARVGQAPKVTCSQNVNPLFVGNCQAQRTSTTNRDCLTFHQRLLTLINLPACFFAGKGLN